MIQLYIYSGSFSYSFPLWLIAGYIASLLNNQFNLFFFLLQIMVTFIHVPRVWCNWHAEATRGKQRWFSHSVVSNSCDPMDCSLPMGFSRQEYWSGLPFPSPGDLPSPGLQPRSPALQADSLPTGLLGKPWKLLKYTQDPSWSGHLTNRVWGSESKPPPQREPHSNRVSVKTYTLWVPFAVHFLHFYVADSFTVLFFHCLEEWALCLRTQPWNT